MSTLETPACFPMCQVAERAEPLLSRYRQASSLSWHRQYLILPSSNARRLWSPFSRPDRSPRCTRNCRTSASPRANLSVSVRLKLNCRALTFEPRHYVLSFLLQCDACNNTRRKHSISYRVMQHSIRQGLCVKRSSPPDLPPMTE